MSVTVKLQTMYVELQKNIQAIKKQIKFNIYFVWVSASKVFESHCWEPRVESHLHPTLRLTHDRRGKTGSYEEQALCTIIFIFNITAEALQSAHFADPKKKVKVKIKITRGSRELREGWGVLLSPYGHITHGYKQLYKIRKFFIALLSYKNLHEFFLI